MQTGSTKFCWGAALSGALTAFIANGCALSSDDASAHALTTKPAPNEEWRPYSASTDVKGKSLSEWATEYMLWNFSRDTCDVPLYDPDGSTCTAFQREDGPVFFLQQGEPVTERDRCKVPSDKPVLVPLIVFSTDNAGVAAEMQLSEAALEEVAGKIRESFNDLRLLIDGKEIENLDAYEVPPTRYSYELGPEPNLLTCLGLPGFTGVIDPSFVTGYFVLLPPPPPGEHRLEYAGVGYARYEELGMDVATATHVRISFTIPEADTN